MHQDNSIKLFTKIFNNLGKKWPEFIRELKKNSDVDDESQIYNEDFVKILFKFGADISE